MILIYKFKEKGFETEMFYFRYTFPYIITHWDVARFAYDLPMFHLTVWLDYSGTQF